MKLTETLTRTPVYLLAGMILICTSGHVAAAEKRPRDHWDFRFKDFVIGAWWGPGSTEPEVKLYQEAGFNVIMVGRYMQLDNYGDADKGLRELDLAQKYGLGAMFDTYTKNDRPWGGHRPADATPMHHAASLIELQWLFGKVGQHPALVGFMIGDDQASVMGRSDDCIKFLHAQGAHLIPWLCGWISSPNLAEHNNPIANPQIYPTLDQWGQPAEELARQYAATYAKYSRQCRDLGLVFWPMFNAAPPNGRNGREQVSDSLLRFPAYAAVAYGAEGIWYFCYNAGSLQKLGTYQTEDDVRAALTPLYPIAKTINHRLATWGPRVLGRTSPGLFGTAFAQWPFPKDTVGFPSAEALVPPGEGKLLEAMNDGILAGILTKVGEPPLVMVVDCHVSKGFGDVPPREVTVRFAPAVSRVNVLEGKESKPVEGNEVKLTLEAGGGQLLELEGKELDALYSAEAICASPPRPEAAAAPRTLAPADLGGIKAAKLRIDVFGSNREEQYQQKTIKLNGHRLARVPAGNGDTWSLKVVDLGPDQLAWIQRANEVTVRTECADAWKFRNVTLAVQLSDGTWAKSNSDQTTYSVPDWAHSEGNIWGRDGAAGPILLRFE